MDFKCDAETRACQLELEIWHLIDAGELELMHGSYGSKREGSPCQACALGSAARAICGLEATESIYYGQSYIMKNSHELRNQLKARGVATYEESLLMEMGFEGFGTKWYAAQVPASPKPDTSDPFYKLGQRLRAKQRPTAGGE